MPIFPIARPTGGNSGEFRYVFVREICGYSRERSGFAAICVEIFDRSTGSRVSNGGTLACSAPFTFARFSAIRGSAADLRPFAAIRVEIFGQPTGSRVSNREQWHVPLHFGSGDSRHSRERSGFAAIRVEIFGRPPGSRVSNGEHWHVPLHCGSGDSQPFAGAQRICGHLRWDLWPADWFAGVERGNIGMFRTIYLRKICGHSR